MTPIAPRPGHSAIGPRDGGSSWHIGTTNRRACRTCLDDGWVRLAAQPASPETHEECRREIAAAHEHRREVEQHMSCPDPSEHEAMTPTNPDTDLTAMKLHGTTDASVWTNEFDRIYPDSRPDWATMFGWFANAIEVGRMFGVRETLTPTPDPLREALQALRGYPVDDGGFRRWQPDSNGAYVGFEDALDALAQPAPAGSHGDGVNDSHYDRGCGRCIEQRDQTRPDVPWDTIYAEVEP